MSTRFRKAFIFGAMVCAPVATVQAARLGHPGVSTKGATTAQHQWNLICDPADATIGSFTTDYSSSASISEIDPIFPYKIDSVTVVLANDLVSSTHQVISTALNPNDVYKTYYPNGDGSVYINPNSFNGMPQTGQLQVKWELIPGQTPPEGTDDNTYSLLFNPNVTSGNPGMIHASFTDTMAYYGGALPADFYSGFNSDGTPFTYSADPHSPNYTPNVQTNTVLLSMTLGNNEGGGGGGDEGIRTKSFDVVAAPEPATIGIVGILSGLGLLRRRRR